MMQVEKAERAVAELISQISRSEIKLPELQRDFVWKPTQVAKFIDSLYRGYPSGSLLFWETDEQQSERALAIGGQAVNPMKPPMYLVDGQQRLTSLFRVYSDHEEAQIVYNVDLDQFKNQTAITRNDPRWVKVFDLLKPKAGLVSLVQRIVDAGCTTNADEIGERLTRLRSLRDHRFHIEILRGFDQRQMAEIFVRVNSGGRHLDNQDLALAMLSADWPGLVGKLQTEAKYWRQKGYGDLDVNFLSRAFASAMGQNLGSVKVGKVSEQELERSWGVVKDGLRLFVKLLSAQLHLTRTDVLPNLSVMIPPIILLGQLPNGKVDRTTAHGIIYWFLVATIGDRYSDSKLARDVAAAKRPKALPTLLKNLPTQPRVTPDYLVGRTKESPYFFLSLIVTHLKGAHDWWSTTNLMGLAGDQRMEYHHVHPVATLEELYEKADINDLANLIFISGKANRRISDKSPRVYFPGVPETDLRAHLIPLDESLRDAINYQSFLAERRRLLAGAMNELLDKFRPDWLDAAPTGKPSETDGLAMRLVLYASAWDPGRVILTANANGTRWSASVSMEDLEQAITAAGVAGIPGDLDLGGESVPVEVNEGSVELPAGPFILTGTPEEWEQVFERERAAARSLSAYVVPTEGSWAGGERVRFPVTSTD